MDGSQVQSIENIIDETDLTERDFWFEDVGWLETMYKSPGNLSLGAWVDLTEAASGRVPPLVAVQPPGLVMQGTP